MRLTARSTPLQQADEAELAELVGRGLVRQHTGRDGRRMVQLTAEGRQHKAELQAKLPPRRGASLQDLLALEQRLLVRIERLLDARLAGLEPRLPTMPPPHVQAAAAEQLADRVLAAIQQLDLRQQLDGIVPLRALRAHLADVSATVLDRELVNLERQYRIDLKIANDPSTVPEPESGIRMPGRGLAYFAALR